MHERDRDAGRSARGEQPNGTARGRAWMRRCRRRARRDRDADRPVSVGERHVREQAAIEDGVDRLAVVPALLGPRRTLTRRGTSFGFPATWSAYAGLRTIPPRMRDPRIEQYARLLVDTCVGVQPGWEVIVMSTPIARPLLEELARQIARKGAYVSCASTSPARRARRGAGSRRPTSSSEAPADRRRTCSRTSTA